MKFLFALLIAGLPAFADEIAAPADSVPTARQEAPGDGCLSKQTVEQFSRSAAVNALVKEKRSKEKIKKSRSLYAVRKALEKHRFVKSQADLEEEAERGGSDDNLQAEGDKVDQPARQAGITRPINAKDSAYWLESNGYVNLLKCPDWKNPLKDARHVPKGAVVVYRHARNDKHPGHIEIKTPSGFWSDRPRDSQDYPGAYDVVGVFVKP